MASDQSCAACGCEIADDKTSAGAALRHGSKLYCAECAAMILPPEELERLSNSARAAAAAQRKKAPQAAALLADDDILGEEPEPTESALVEQTKPSPPSAAPASRVQRAAGRPPSRRETATVNGVRRPSTRTPNAPPASAPSAPSAPAAPSGSGRRGGTAVIARRDSGSANRFDRAEKDNVSGRENSRARKRKADSTGLYIGLGVGAVVLIAAALFLFSGSKPAKTLKGKAKEEFVDNDKTPSAEYARRAEDYAAKKDSRNAVLMYGKAAERAEKEGNTQKAKDYNMQSVSIEKASTLK